MGSMRHGDVTADLEALDAKVNALLPARYQHCYASVSPDSMGSTGLKYGPDGRVAWDQIWTTFCDLALAGGPPHRGTFLEPARESDVVAEPARHAEVVAEIGRALGLTSGSRTAEGYAPGWVGVPCLSAEEAAWLQLAVTAENVSARRRGAVLQLPAGPEFRAEKEIKNVVVALTKALHYWDGHLTDSQQTLAGQDMCEAATPDEAAADPSGYEAAAGEMEIGLRESGLPISSRRYAGWIGVEAPAEEEAVWLLRAVLVERVLARREGRTLYLPVSVAPAAGQADRVAFAFRRAWELWKASSPRRTVWRRSDSP